MPNVDSQLHNAADQRDRAPELPAKTNRGAAGGIYIGPVLSRAAVDGEGATLTHATGADAGGADGSTGYRGSNSYSVDGDATGQGMGAGGTAHVRRTGRTMYRGNGFAGGSIPGYPAQRASQRAAAAAGGGEGPADDPTGAAAFIDKRTAVDAHGGRYLGSGGRGTRVNGTTVTLHTSSRGGSGTTNFIPRPTVEDSDAPAAGVIGVIGGSGKTTCDLHADDITGGAKGLAGCEVMIVARDTDTDEDAGVVGKADFDSITEGDLVTGLTAGTYAVYARFKDTAGNVGPLSARGTVVVS